MHPNEKQDKSIVKKALIISLVAMLVLILAWHIIFPFIGVAVAIGAAAWALIIVTIVVMCVAILLFFILSGIGIVVISIIAAAWVLMSIILFPFLFPLFVPILILLLCIAFLCRRKLR